MSRTAERPRLDGRTGHNVLILTDRQLFVMLAGQALAIEVLNSLPLEILEAHIQKLAQTEALLAHANGYAVREEMPVEEFVAPAALRKMGDGIEEVRQILRNAVQAAWEKRYA